MIEAQPILCKRTKITNSKQSLSIENRQIGVIFDENDGKRVKKRLDYFFLLIFAPFLRKISDESPQKQKTQTFGSERQKVWNEMCMGRAGLRGGPINRWKFDLQTKHKNLKL
jgi:hypothetical protein